MNKLLLLVLTLCAAVCLNGCTGNNPTNDKAKQDAKDSSQAKKEKEPEDKVKVYAHGPNLVVSRRIRCHFGRVATRFGP